MATVSTSTTCAAHAFKITANFDTWESGTSVAGNYSTVSWHLKVTCTDTAGWTSFGGSTRNHAGWVYCGIDGNQVYGCYTGLPNGMANGTVLVDQWGSTNVGHNNDGTKSVSFFVDLDQSDDDVGRINYYFYDGPRSTGTLGLSTIARASQPSINTYPSNSPDITAGTSCTVHMNRASSDFTHSIWWQFGSNDWHTDGFSQATGITNNVAWTPPISMMNQIPNASSGTGTIWVTTYNGSTKVGDSTISFTLHQPSDSSPTISSVEYAENGTLADGTTKLTSKGVEATTVIGQISKKMITITASTKYSSTLSKITCSHNGSTQTATKSPASFTFNYPVNTGDSKSYFSWTVTDSRGNSTSGSTNMTYVNYIKPVVSVVTPSRDSAVVSTGKLSGSGMFFNGTVGNTANSVTVTYTYNSAAHTASITKSGNNWSFSNAALSGVDPNGNYSITVKVVDTLGFSSSKAIVLPKAIPTLWTGNRTVKVNDYLIINSDMKIAGKTLKRYMLDFFYPVGAIYTSTASTSPATLFGGTWKEITGRFLLAHDSSHPAASTGGEFDHILTVDEMPSHSHPLQQEGHNPGTTDGASKMGSYPAEIHPDHDRNWYLGTQSVGGSRAHNTTPPYLSVYMWKRIG